MVTSFQVEQEQRQKARCESEDKGESNGLLQTTDDLQLEIQSLQFQREGLRSAVKEYAFQCSSLKRRLEDLQYEVARRNVERDDAKEALKSPSEVRASRLGVCESAN